MTIRRMQVRYTPDDRARSVYQYVAFDVPPGSPSVAVTYAYDRSGAVVDLGLFDPDGFRGWSGGARSSAIVSPEAATPGYLPGVLPPGRWSVILGLHRVPPRGVTVNVQVDVAAEPPPTSPPPPRHRGDRPQPRSLPAAPGRRWVAADLHTHTQHSDGQLTIDELASLAAERGIDVLAVTDHNTVSHHAHLAAAGGHAGIHLLPGQEVTTDQGHANCFGGVGWIDFREPPEHWLAAAEERGAVMSINHPVAGDCAWTYPQVPSAPLVEAWHSSWDRRGLDALRWFQRHLGVAVGGSDFHDYGAGGLPGQPTTWIELPADPDALDDEAVLAAVAAGVTTISAEPRGPCLVRDEGVLVACSAEGLTLLGPDGDRRRILGEHLRVPVEEGLHLLVDDGGLVHALSA